MVTILGDPASVSAQAEQDIRALGYRTQRVTGAGLADPGMQPYVRDIERLRSPTSVTHSPPRSRARHGATTCASARGQAQLRSDAVRNRTCPDAQVLTIGAGARQAMSSNWPNRPKWTVTELPEDPTEFVMSMSSSSSRGIVLVDRSASDDLALAAALAHAYSYTMVPVDPGGPLPPGSLRTWLSQSSAAVDQILTVGSGDRLGSIEAAVAGVVSGPLGHVDAPPAQPPAFD